MHNSVRGRTNQTCSMPSYKLLPDIQVRSRAPRPGPALSLMDHATTWQFFAEVLLYRCSHGWNAWVFPPFVLPSRALHGISILCVKFFLSCFLFIPDCTDTQDGNATRRFCSSIWIGKLYILRQSVRKEWSIWVPFCSTKFGMET